MKIPMSWLREYVDIPVETNEFAALMTMSGSKVETVEALGADIDKVVVGNVVSLVKHPQADKLFITKTDIGTEVLQIVTGATNLYEGAYVPVALVGSTLHGGVKIGETYFRGELSSGMLCSIGELGYTSHDYPEADPDGIYVFPTPQNLGADAREAMMLCDEVVEFEITSNRPDCYSVAGIANEAAATFGTFAHFEDFDLREEGQGNAADYVSVDILNPELCPRYIARVVTDVVIEPSPLWLRHRLTAAGMRPINNIVDITNYVMLEFGQPLHAFDINCIANSHIIVRNAKAGEEFVTLDGEMRILDETMLVIADEEKAVAIAGVMGGENSKITGGANAVLFESANFNGTNIRLTSKKLGLRTDASGKYEKGLDPNLSTLAVNRAVYLIEKLGWGKVVPGMVDNYPRPRVEWTVKYDPARINALLGTDISAEQMEKYLLLVGVKASNGIATIPTNRPDLESEADIAEEVGRLYGYDKIESTVMGSDTVGRRNRKQKLETLTRDAMVTAGYSEMLSYAFESPKVFDKLCIPKDSPLRNAITINNPLGLDYSIMRTTTANALLTSLSTNYNRRNESARLFELAKVYEAETLPLEGLPNEPNILTLGGYGSMDFFNIKGDVESLLSRLGIKADFTPDEVTAYLHPGRRATIFANGEPVGVIGEIHPQVLINYEIGTRAYMAALNLDKVFALANMNPVYTALPKYPGVKRDLALLADETVLSRDIENAIRESAGQLLEEVTLFDMFTGGNIPQGKKSLAYSLSFRSPERTLSEDEVAAAISRVMAHLEEKLTVKLRG